MDIISYLSHARPAFGLRIMSMAGPRKRLVGRRERGNEGTREGEQDVSSHRKSGSRRYGLDTLGPKLLCKCDPSSTHEPSTESGSGIDPSRETSRVLRKPQPIPFV